MKTGGNNLAEEICENVYTKVEFIRYLVPVHSIEEYIDYQLQCAFFDDSENKWVQKLMMENAILRTIEPMSKAFR